MKRLPPPPKFVFTIYQNSYAQAQTATRIRALLYIERLAGEVARGPGFRYEPSYIQFRDSKNNLWEAKKEALR